MIGTLLVPLDGSDLAERSLVYAQPLAERSHASLLLVRAARIGADESEITHCQEYLQSIARLLPREPEISVARGRPAEVIAEVSEKATDPIIVMSTHGRGGLHRWMSGSVADEVVRSSTTPVLLVRAGMELPKSLQIRKILVPVDGSSVGDRVLEYASEIAALFDSEIHLLRVVDTPSAYALMSRNMETAVTGDILEEIITNMRNEARQYVDDQALLLSERGIRVKPIVLEGYAGESIVKYEHQGVFQLVIMATAARRGVGRVVFGSVAERMLKLGHSPVMMIRPLFSEGDELD